MLGSFGDIVFVASEETMRTFNNFSRSTAARWTVHNIHLDYPRAEYIGPGQDTVTFTMRFDIRYGINPKEEMDRLIEYCRWGRSEHLVIGDASPGVNRWYIESVDQSWDYLDGNGNLIVSNVAVTLKEFI